jgi:hypothetical protein
MIQRPAFLPGLGAPRSPDPGRRSFHRTLSPILPKKPLRRRLAGLAGCAALALWSIAASAEDFQGSTHKLDYDSEPIHYSTTAPKDPVASAQKTLKASPNKGWLNYDPKYGYLPAVLEMFHVPVSSQMLVFSKTSVQRHDIDPENPRALYFSDTLYIGFIPGAPVLEIASVDPQLGAVFYTVNQDKDEPVRFRRDENCLNCHGAARSMGVPGFVLRSLDTEPNGEPISGTESESVTHFTPFSLRWGGWYVTGAPTDWVHRGNRPGTQKALSEDALKTRIKPENYPGQGSELLPLLVHDHQVHMHNYLTRLNFEARIALQTYGHLRYLRRPVDAFLRYLLFTEEASLPSPLPKDTPFAADFLKKAHRDSKGRSLRDLDLESRLFKYPCSFLIESDGFQKMPDPLRELLLRKLWEILTGQNHEPDFANLSPGDRRAVLEILRDTLGNLPDYWKQDAPPAEAPQ